jgi:hypothetical protein
VLAFVLCGCETWSLTLREEHRHSMFEKRVLRKKIFGPKREEANRTFKKPAKQGTSRHLTKSY